METGGVDFALVVFEHTGGAEQAYSRAPRRVGGVDWAQEVAFVEHHHRDRLVMRGAFAGHYVDVDDEQDFIGRQTVEGVLAGGAVGALFGPAGLAVGLVGGGMAGGVAMEHSGPRLRSALFDELRTEVPEGSSAVVMFAPPPHVDAMLSALEGHGGGVVRHRLTADDARILAEAVAGSPSVAPRPS
jgi:uncharacterized membrane protein